jgi:hypothetical protein
MTELKTLEQFISENGVTMTAKRSLGQMNPNMPNPDMRHWRCTLKRDKDTLTVWFSQGSAHKEPPTAADVLNSLSFDSCATGETFESWANEYGYDTDSRSAEKTYKACLRYARLLEGFLGSDLYNELMGEVERL